MGPDLSCDEKLSPISWTPILLNWEVHCLQATRRSLTVAF